VPTRERDITTKVLKWLKNQPASVAEKIHGGPMQNAGLPDIYFTCKALRGQSVWIEMKRPGEKERPLQALRGRRMRCAGCEYFVCSSLGEVEKIVGELIYEAQMGAGGCCATVG
jgi:hypothetical protein